MLEKKKRAGNDYSNSGSFKAQSGCLDTCLSENHPSKTESFFNTAGIPFVFCDWLKRMVYISHASN